MRLRTLLMIGMGANFSEHLLQVELPFSLRGALSPQQEEMLRTVLGVFSYRLKPVERWPLSPTIPLAPPAPSLTPYVKAALPSGVRCWWLPLSVCELVEKPRFMPSVLHGDGLLREALPQNWKVLHEMLPPNPNWFKLVPLWEEALAKAVHCRFAETPVVLYSAQLTPELPHPEVYLERIAIDFGRPSLARAGHHVAPTVVVTLRRKENRIPYEIPLTGHQIPSLALMLARSRLTDGLERLAQLTPSSEKDLSSRAEARSAAEYICQRLLSNRHLPLRPRLYGTYVLYGNRLRAEPERVVEELTCALENVSPLRLEYYRRHADELAQERSLETESALSR